MRGLEEPILAISDWFQRQVTGDRFNALARQGNKAILFFDEVQNIDRWDAQLKSLVDNAAVKVVVTGSSALRIEMGRDRLAGRICTQEAGVPSLPEIGALLGLDSVKPFLPDKGLGSLIDIRFWRESREYRKENAAFRDESFQQFSERGAIP